MDVLPAGGVCSALCMPEITLSGHMLSGACALSVVMVHTWICGAALTLQVVQLLVQIELPEA